MNKLRDLLFVPHCAGCGERLAVGMGALCNDCHTAYEMEKERGCPYCGQRFSACLCAGDFLGKNGVKEVSKLFQYYPRDGEAVTNRMIYLLKHRAPRPLVALLAHDLAETVAPRLTKDRSHLIVTYAPRGRRARYRFGLDHMAILSRAVAEELGGVWHPLLSRREGREQKKRPTRRERFLNMKEAYTYIGKEDLRAAQILLLDDVTTSGATLMFAARTLRRAGARHLITAVIGQTLLKN